MNRKPLWLTSIFALSLLALPGCGSDDANADSKGAGACTVEDLGDGTSAIVCPDGTRLVVSHGKDGADGDKGDKGDKGDAADCTLGTSEDGRDTLTCGGQTVTIGDPCEDGYYGDVYLWNRDNTGSKAFTLFQVTSCTWIRGDLEIDGFDGETLPKALSRLEKVDGDIYVKYNDELTTVAFPALAEVGGDLDIKYNSKLETIGDFPALKTVGGQLYIVQNEELISVGNFPKLETTGDWIDFWDNAKLESIGSFDKLVSIDSAGITVEDHPSLVEMGSFPALESVEWLYFVYNDSLESLPAFASLKTIAGDLDIRDNAELTSIAGLASLEKIEGDVSVAKNPKLPQCHVDDILADIDYDVDESEILDNDDTATCP